VIGSSLVRRSERTLGKDGEAGQTMVWVGRGDLVGRDAPNALALAVSAYSAVQQNTVTALPPHLVPKYLDAHNIIFNRLFKNPRHVVFG
jgi:hypothetical protein